MKPSEILKAHEDGLTVEWKGPTNKDWAELNCGDFTNLGSLRIPGFEYRIKKEPRTFWVVLRKDGTVVTAHGDEWKACEQVGSLNGPQGLTQHRPYSVTKVTENL